MRPVSAFLLLRRISGFAATVFYGVGIASGAHADGPADSPADGPYEARILITTSDWAVLSSEILASLNTMPRAPGQTFKKGDTLVVFNCDTYEAQRAAGAADVRQARAQLDAQERLFELRSAGALDVEVARAALDRADAHLKLQDAYLSRCKVVAPYDGTVVRWAAQPHQTVAAGTELIEIVGSAGLELEMIVPSIWLAWLKPGQQITAQLDETGEQISGRISRLSARIDPVSQTIKVYAAITTAKKNLLAGMSGRAIIQPGNSQ